VGVDRLGRIGQYALVGLACAIVRLGHHVLMVGLTYVGRNVPAQYGKTQIDQHEA
jgi:hypothetical protein